MILLDVNLMVYAFRPDDDRQLSYKHWLDDQVRDRREIGLVDAAISGFVRIVTNPRVWPDPAPVTDALDFVGRLRSARGVRWIAGGERAWQVLDAWGRHDATIAGNRVPDAHLAATAVAHRARLATADGGFARYPGLRWFDPAQRPFDG